jgi:NTE family protein
MFFGCASYPVNSRLETFEVTDNVHKPDIESPERSEEILLVLAFSGGGTRAAALSYGVLEALGKVEIPGQAGAAGSSGAEGSHTLLDEVDTISSVSGGSFTAAYYALHKEGIFDDFKQRFLYYNVQRGLLLRTLSPINWIRLSSPRFGRSDLAAEYYDNLLFHGATYADIWEKENPELLVQATDMGDGVRFGFTRHNFALICSDLSEFPVSRAVAASAAFPGAFTSVRLHNYAGSCGYELDPWVAEALEERDISSRTFHAAKRLNTYTDPDKKAFIHLMDGGISDNLGIRGPLEIIIAMGGARESLEYIGLDETRRMIFIIVNAEGETQNPWGLTQAGPKLASALGVFSSVMISGYNFETIELLHQYVSKWSAENRDLERGEEPIEFYAIEVAFNALSDQEERRYYSSMPTSFSLPEQSVDDLIEVGGRLLYQSEEFQRLVSDIGGSIPASISQDSADDDAEPVAP